LNTFFFIDVDGKKKNKKLLFARNWNECRFILERKFEGAERNILPVKENTE
jgi:hypothetical protein